MTLQTNLSNAFTRVATEAKALRTIINGNQPGLAALNTTVKTDLVAAINEVLTLIGGAGASINDETTTTATVWSSSKTNTAINSAVSGLVDSAPGVLDTLNELAAALGDDPNFATTVSTELGKKAPLASPTFTGTVTVPDNAFAIAKINGLQTALNGLIPRVDSQGTAADRVVFWDESAGAYAGLSLSGLGIAGTTLSVDAASATVAGKVELATNVDVATGTDSARAVTPAGLRSVTGDPEANLVTVFEAGLV